MPIFDYGYGTGGYTGSGQAGYGDRSSAMGYGMERGAGMGISTDRYSGMATAMAMGGGYDSRSDIGYMSGPSPYARARSRSPIGVQQHMMMQQQQAPEVKCYKCTKVGHMAKDCTAELLCYSCNGVGHISRDCTDSTNGPKCYNCQNIGHMAKDCPSLIAQGMVAQGIIGPQGVNADAALNGVNIGGGRGGGYSGGRGAARGGGGYMGGGGMMRGGFMGPPRGGRGGMNCHQCGGYGHMARDCPTEKKCYKCQGLGHIAKLCPTNGMDGPRSFTCFKCNQEGHFARDCKADTANPPLTSEPAEGTA